MSEKEHYEGVTTRAIDLLARVRTVLPENYRIFKHTMVIGDGAMMLDRIEADLKMPAGKGGWRAAVNRLSELALSLRKDGLLPAAERGGNS